VTPLVDSHCHLNFDPLNTSLDDVIQRARDNGVGHMLCVSVTLETFPEIHAIAHSHPDIFASVGVHPNEREGREPSVDFQSAHAAGLRGMRDEQVLTFAAASQRVLVSHDVGTMPLHFRAFLDAGNDSAGVFLIPQSLDIGTAIDELVIIWLASDAVEWRNRLGWTPL